MAKTLKTAPAALSPVELLRLADLQAAALEAAAVAATPAPETWAEKMARIEAEEVAALEAAEAKAIVPPAAVIEPEAHVPGDLSAMMDAVTEADRDVMAAAVLGQLDDRATFERVKNPAGESIHITLNKTRSKLGSRSAAALLTAVAFDPAIINRSISEGKRFNVYAFDKMADLISLFRGTGWKNAVNVAIVRSLFKFRANGVAFTGLMAQAAASDKVKVDSAMQALLIRHTVSDATADTQSSSTLSALKSLGIIVNRGTPKAAVWVLTDTPQTRALEKLAA